MSRKIKFRAWDKYNAEWFCPTYEAYRGELQHLVLAIDTGGIIRIELNDLGELVKLGGGQQYELEQFTGLKDSQGVDIYEGDIVEIKNHPFQKKPDTMTGIQIDGKYIIEWSDAGCWCAGTLLLAKLIPWIKVIGNIHEDGQLLEADK